MKKQLKFERCNYVITDQRTPRQRLKMNKKQNVKRIAKRDFAISTKDDDNDWFDSRSIERGQSNRKRRITKRIHVPSKNREHIDTMQELSKKKMSDVYKK